ncbi:MAG: hypothetical protein HQL37_01625 [Alphaproteobacteria bacterium]|nr:hypothetical protein [Alphaproteobacteria bacterium]
MPYQPSLNSVHVDAALTNFSVAYVQSEDAFVAGQVFPVMPVEHKSDKFFTYQLDAYLRAAGAQVPYGTEAPRGGLVLSTDSYDVGMPKRWAQDITPDIRANADAALSDIDQQVAAQVMRALLIGREVDFVTNYMSTGVWGTDMIGGTNFTVWSNQAGSDPIYDVDTGKTTVLQNTGMEVNTMTVAYNVHQALRRHPLILERIKYGGGPANPALVTPQMLAAVFEVERYIVAKSVQVTSAEGQPITTGFVVGNDVLLTHSARSPGIMTPSAGFNFVWSALTGVNNLGIAAYRYPMPQLGIAANGATERVEGTYAYAMKVTGKPLGYFLHAAV